MMAVNASRASAALLSSVGNDDAPAEPARPASRLDALEHKIQSEQVDPETGEVTEEGRTEEDTGEGPDLANAIADIDAAEMVVGVNSRLAEYEELFTGDDLVELRIAAAIRSHRAAERRVGEERVRGWRSR